MRTLQNSDDYGRNRPVVSEYVEVSNELESTLNKVRDATDLVRSPFCKQNSDEKH